MDREQASAAGRKERLQAHLLEVARERDPDRAPAGHAHVADYILRTPSPSQERLREHHRFDYLGRRHENIVLDLPGRSAGGFILVGAHYDGVPGSPGADDNGSAIAVLLELASEFAAEPAPRPLRLVAFDLEERAISPAARAYAADLHGRREPLHLMIALEMLGYCDPHRPGSQRYAPGLRYFYPDRGDFIGLIGNLRAVPPMRRLARALRRSVPCEWLPVPGRGHLLPDTRRSDHSPFWDLGYPALMVTDTADLRNPHYHTTGDRLETLDMDFLTGVCAGLIAGLRAL